VSETTLLKLGSIRIDGDTQLRAETNQDIIANYVRDMQDGDIFPPVVVYYDGVNYWLSDGFHRYLATQQTGNDEILATIREGTRRDALLYAAEANRKHGIAFTNKDKRRIVTLFLNDPEWHTWSDREIARRTGVSNTFVSNLRAQLSTVDSDEMDEGTRAELDQIARRIHLRLATGTIETGKNLCEVHDVVPENDFLYKWASDLLQMSSEEITAFMALYQQYKDAVLESLPKETLRLIGRPMLSWIEHAQFIYS
jgi:ParB-like chromosome segregation protein Spo0J